jgi:hypothetical protein
MKARKSYSLLCALAMLGSGISGLNAQNLQSAACLNVQELSNSKWNTADGIPYKLVPGVNLGATSFEVLTGNEIAYLCNASNEIIITDKTSGAAIKKFPVLFAARDFVYDNGLFYVLNARQVSVYDTTGKNVSDISFLNNVYTGVERLARYNNETYLLLPSGNSLKIESAGKTIEAKEYVGWITNAGYFIKTKISGKNTYSFTLIKGDKMIDEKTITTDKPMAGVYVAGAASNRLYLDIQTFVTESPISVERKIVSFEITPKEFIGNIVASIKVPDCYYVLSNNDFHVSSSGTLLNMVTAPQGVYVYSLAETKTKNAAGYPDFITATKYHFNDHLVKVDAQ